jgi:uncharacterized protein with von Willebrand factor type A (vWA) domain
VRGLAQGLDHQLDPVQVTAVGVDGDAVGVLDAARPVEAEITQLLEDRVEDAGLNAIIEQALAKLGDHILVEAGVIQREVQRVFPIQPEAHVIRRLAVGAALQALEDQHEGEEGRRDRRAAGRGVEVGEVRVVEAVEEHVADEAVDGSLVEHLPD